VKHLKCEFYYQQLHLKYKCNLARYWLQAPWGWHNSVETCKSVIICEIIAHLLVIVQNNSSPYLQGPDIVTLSELTDSQRHFHIRFSIHVLTLSFHLHLPIPRWDPSFGFPATFLDISLVLYLSYIWKLYYFHVLPCLMDEIFPFNVTDDHVFHKDVLSSLTWVSVYQLHAIWWTWNKPRLFRI